MISLQHCNDVRSVAGYDPGHGYLQAPPQASNNAIMMTEQFKLRSPEPEADFESDSETSSWLLSFDFQGPVTELTSLGSDQPTRMDQPEPEDGGPLVEHPHEEKRLAPVPVTVTGGGPESVQLDVSELEVYSHDSDPPWPGTSTCVLITYVGTPSLTDP
jgi:hypothetical protein